MMRKSKKKAFKRIGFFVNQIMYQQGIFGPCDIHQIFQNDMQHYSMFKVVLKLHQLQVRLREGEADIFIKKKNQILPLCSRCKILNGIAPIDITRELFIDSDQPVLQIQVVLFLGNQKKIGGETILSIFEWQPNIFHHTVSQLNNSPDPHSNVAFDFYYFKHADKANQDLIFKEQERMQEEYRQIERGNRNLLHEKKELQKEVSVLRQKNSELKQNYSEMVAEISELEQSHQERMNKGETAMQKSSLEYRAEQEKIQELMKIVEQIKKSPHSYS